MNKHSFWNRRIPTYFSLIALVIGVGITGFLVQQGVIFRGLAAPGNTPGDVTVTNSTDTSFTVSYLTTDNVFGTLTVREDGADDSSSTLILDDRDKKKGAPQTYTAHAITVTDLKPKTSYRFSINSGGETFQKVDSLDTFVATTGTTLLPSNSKYQISGKVVTPDGAIPEGAIITLQTTDSQILSTLVRDDGSYTFSSPPFRTDTLASFIQLTPESTLSLSVKSLSGSSTVSVLLNRANPVPLITLSKSYDFSYRSDPLDASVTATSSSDTVDFPATDDQTEPDIAGSVSITSPKEAEQFSDARPQFRGTTAPNSEVAIAITAEEEIQTNVIADGRGNWSYRPRNPLTPGEQTISITTQDQFGIAKTASQDFTILASGSQFTEPSVAPNSPTPTTVATPTPTKAAATPTRSPTRGTSPTPTIQPTATPTRSVTVPPTSALSPTQTAISLSPTPTGTLATSMPISTSPQPSLPPTGPASGILYAAIGAVTIIVGLLLFFLSQGGLPL